MRPGEPRAAANVGQNFCHKKAVKCGFACTFLGSAVANVRMHSVRKSEPPVSVFFGLLILCVIVYVCELLLSTNYGYFICIYELRFN